MSQVNDKSKEESEVKDTAQETSNETVEVKVEKNSKEKSTETKNTSNKIKHFTIRTIAVLLTIALFVIVNYVSYKAEYIHFIEIGEQYKTTFEMKNSVYSKMLAGMVAGIFVYIFVLNIFIKHGLKKFFVEEKKTMPKLPNKSLAAIIGMIGGAIATSALFDKYMIFKNAAMFGHTDPIFDADIGYYMFSLPFIQAIIAFMAAIVIVSIVYVAFYFVIALNTYFNGVSSETLKNNTMLKLEYFFVVILAILLAAYVIISSQNILTGNMITIGDANKIELVGAGKTDVTIKLWGYRLLGIVIFIAAIRLLRNIKKSNFKQGMISVMIVPMYLVGLFIVVFYYQTFHVSNNEFDTEKKYIAYNIDYTKVAYGIDISTQNIDSYTELSSEQISNNQSVISNIPLISKDVVQSTIVEQQENKLYYTYDNTYLATYKFNNKDKLIYITPREISSEITESFENKTYLNTHGYSLVMNSVNDSDGDGYLDYILSGFEGEDDLGINQPRIYFGLETNSTIVVNSPGVFENDYPKSPTAYELTSYNGEAGLHLDFKDRFILGLSEGNLRLLNGKFDENTRIITDRNVIERAKRIFPNVIYDEEPYLVISDAGKLVWVLDGYTRSNSYPYSQTSTIDLKGYREDINYIRNSVKVLVDAYDGTTKFYITDYSDPIIMTYRNMYPGLFTEEKIPEDIASHFVYPKFLFEIQSQMLSAYHGISEDTLYRADDLWQVSSKASSTNSVITGIQMEPYYTVLKTIDSDSPKLGLMLTYNRSGKQNIISYAVGTVVDGNAKLSLYKFNSDSNVYGIIQLNNQIEQDEVISNELSKINTTGTRLIRDMIIVPFNKSILYVEPVYQVLLNSESDVPILKKVIVASGNTVAIGNSLEEALENLFSGTNSIDIEILDTEDIDQLVDSIIKANQNLEESMNANNFEMIGKDMAKLQALIKQLEAARANELERQNVNEIDTSNIENIVNEEVRSSLFSNSTINQNLVNNY